MANLTIESACDILTNDSLGIAIDRLAILSTKILNASKEKCLDYMYSKMIHKLRNVTWANEEAEGGNAIFILMQYKFFKSIGDFVFLVIF